MNKPKFARPVAKLRQGRTDWYKITNLDGGGAEILLYDEIGYYGVTAQDFVRELASVSGDITLRINSPGGEIFDGMAIYNAFKQHPSNVTVQIDGIAASAASFIAMAGDKVVMTKNATMMIHDGNGLAVGNAADMREMADLLDKCSDNIASIYAEKAGGDVETWREAMQAETWYNAEEALDAGLADEILGASSETTNSWDLSLFNFSGRDKAPAPVIKKPHAFQWDPQAFKAAMEGAIK